MNYSVQVSEYFLDEQLTVKRPAVSAGGISRPVDAVEFVKCSAVLPHDTDLDVNEASMTFRGTWVIYCEHVDIRIGDVLVLDGSTIEYEVERVNKWGTHFLECRVLQKVS